MPLILNLLLRAVLVVAGLVFTASVLLVFAVLLALWSVRALCGRLTGRPVAPFGLRMGPGGAFAQMMRRARPSASRTPRADAAAGLRGRLAEITDVEPHQPRR